jgi:hypothetical protein
MQSIIWGTCADLNLEVKEFLFGLVRPNLYLRFQLINYFCNIIIIN